MIYMRSNPFFSVVIPTYNRVGILYKALDSVLNQTISDFEIIIIDNGSTDGTDEWLHASYKDQRIRYFYQKGTGSPAGPRNTGIRYAEGEWVCFLDSDDLWNFNKLENVKKTIEKNKDCDVVCHSETLFLMGKGSKEVLRYGPYENNFYQKLLMGGNRLSTSATCIRKSFLDNYKLSFNTSTDFAIVEDYDLWLRLAQKGAKFNFIDKPLGKYVVEEGSLSLDTSKVRRNTEAMLKTHVYHLQEFCNNKDRLWGIVMFRLHMQDIKHDILCGKYISALFQLLSKIYASPLGMMFYLKAYAKRKLIK